MTDRCFVDTNVLVYANDRAHPEKKRRALDLLDELEASGRACLSTQVLQEFYVAATRKLHIPWDVARAQVQKLAQLDTVVVTPETVLSAIELSVLRQISFWDALILASASSAGCRVVYSEDLSHGQVIDGVRVVDPFAGPAS